MKLHLDHLISHMPLRLDHLILRTGDPESTFAALAERGFPVLSRVQRVGAMERGIVHAAPIDVEVLRIGDDAPAQPLGYGLGFVADVDFSAAVRALRELGVSTTRCSARAGECRRPPVPPARVPAAPT